MNDRELQRADAQSLQIKVRDDLLAQTQVGREILEDVTALLAALAQHHGPSYLHSLRVSWEVSALTLALGGDQQRIYRNSLAALLHDIGKLQVPRTVLHKAGPRTELERRMVRCHPVLGAQLVQVYPGLADLAPIIEAHHEQPDGQGYPHGLTRAEIPFAALVIAVASTADSLRQRQQQGPEEVAQLLSAGAGRQWEADIVHVAVERLRLGAPLIQESYVPARTLRLSVRERGETY
jgi:putative nucleotidyltransferase with HDIG domain